MAERLKKTLLYTYGVPDMFFSMMISMELYFFAIFLTDYAEFSLAVSSLANIFPASLTPG